MQQYNVMYQIPTSRILLNQSKQQGVQGCAQVLVCSCFDKYSLRSFRLISSNSVFVEILNLPNQIDVIRRSQIDNDTLSTETATMANTMYIIRIVTMQIIG